MVHKDLIHVRIYLNNYDAQFPSCAPFLRRKGNK